MWLFPECDLSYTLWYKVAVDLIVPWPSKTETFSGELYVLTCIDTTTNLVELICIETKLKDSIAWKFEQRWLACYPRPMCVIYKNGGKFTGYGFTCLFHIINIKDVPTTSINTQSNATNTCIKLWCLCWRPYSYLNCHKHHKMSFILLMMDYWTQCMPWDLTSSLL